MSLSKFSLILCVFAHVLISVFSIETSFSRFRRFCPSMVFRSWRLFHLDTFYLDIYLIQRQISSFLNVILRLQNSRVIRTVKKMLTKMRLQIVGSTVWLRFLPGWALLFRAQCRIWMQETPRQSPRTKQREPQCQSSPTAQCRKMKRSLTW